MKIKRMVSFLLCGCLAASLLLGCDNNKEKEGRGRSTEKNGTGKYMEEEIKVPLQENETILRLRKNTKGFLELYVKNESEGKFYKYVSEDGKEWKSEEASWLSVIPNGEITSIAAGQDGKDYAIVTDENSVMHLLKKTGSGEAEEINVPELNGEDKTFFFFGTELEVLKNGRLVLEGNHEIRVYDETGEKKLHSFEQEKTSTDASNPVSVNGNKIVMPDKEYKGFLVKDGESNVAAVSYGAEVRAGKVILEEENDVYFLDKKGIHHMQPEGSLVETLADGSSMTMGTPTAYPKDFVKGTDEDFFVLYETQNGQRSLKHYFYDKQAKVGSGKNLTIYSLQENKTVSQAVSEFNQKYPDVEVSYKTGASDGSTTTADQIRVLNTELLNKNGADILILDNLPVESFIEKGILQDISGILNPMIEDGTLQQNIAECYRDKDGKIYSMPVKYGIPILYGRQDVVDALDTLDSLEKWLDQNPQDSFMGNTSYEQYTDLFVNMYYEELFDEEGKLKEEKIKQCLSNTKKAGERNQAEMERSFLGEDPETGETVTISTWDTGSSIGIYKGEDATSQELKGTIDMMEPFTLMREQKQELVSNKETFAPHTIAGINSGAKETEYAEEFLKILFSGKVQEYDLSDGLPMNVKAWDIIRDKGIDNMEEGLEGELVGVSGVEDGETYTFTMPLKSEIDDLFASAKKLKKPAEADSVLLDMIFEEAKLYYEESKNLEEAVQGIIAKVDTYRAE